ncbi:MAG TPA: methyltransferase domain-containing protein [Acidimicrobiia bacterium]
MDDVAIRAGHRLAYTSALERSAFEAECARVQWWYHSYYFDNGIEVRGDYDIGADIHDYGFPLDLTGATVLDLGTGGGWFAHYFEQRGATVTTYDARGYCDFDVYGRWNYPSVESDQVPDLPTGVYNRDPARSSPRKPDRIDEHGRPVYFSPVSEAFWTMHDLLGSRIESRSGRIYDVSPDTFEGRRFDLVFIGAVLCHLRDPIGALMAARSVCADRIFASTPIVIGEPEGDVGPRQYLPYTDVDRISWWLPNEACFRHWFHAAGFREVDISRSITLRGDVEHCDETGRVHNGDQVHRVGRAHI